MSQMIPGYDIHGQSGEMPLDQMAWRPSVYALIFNAAGELLVLDNHMNGKFDLPGGGLELAETLEQGVIREVWEETGLQVTIEALVLAEDGFFITPGGHYWHTIKLFYRASITGGSLRNSIIEDEWSLNPHWIRIQEHRQEHFTNGWQAVQKVSGDAAT